MLPSTPKLLRAALESDPTITTAQRGKIMQLILQPVEVPKSEPVSTVMRLIRRKEAAAKISVSLRTLDKLAASGALIKRKLPGRKRASGFLESDINNLISA